jgi:hypothetical protein
MSDVHATNARYMAEAKARAEAAKAQRMAPVMEQVARIEASRKDRQVRADHAIVETRERAQSVLTEIGGVAPIPVMGEGLEMYQRRVLEVLAPNTSYSAADRTKIPADVLPRVLESACADVYDNRMHPADLKAGEYRYIVKEDRAGRQVEEIRTGAGTGPGASVFRQLYAESMDKPLYQDTSNLKEQIIL